ncbi:MAG: 50S ribosomal protein L21 [Bacteroidetes bacterium]|nr:MAG: 50S ribosomal protein L21 [Bacteroidota bacterium]
MYAIVEIAGQQFKVEKKQEIFVHRLEEKEGSKVEFSDVMLIDNDGKINIGTPVIKGAVVSAKILEHMKGDKVLVFKKKRRKGYQKLNGHRQYMTRLVIENILENAPKAAAPKAKKEEAPAAPKAEKKEAKPKAPAKPKAAAKPKAEVKKEAPKKPAAKKAAPKASAKKAAPKAEAKPKVAPKAKKADDDKKEDK